MNESFIALLQNPTFLYISAAMFVFLIVILISVVLIRSHVKDKDLLKSHLHTQMTINAKGNEAIVRENERLTKEINNLKITIQTLQTKAGRDELRTLYIYDNVYQKMFERVPGFAQSWALFVRDAEEEVKKMEQGIMPWLRKSVGLLPSKMYTQNHIYSPSKID